MLRNDVNEIAYLSLDYEKYKEMNIIANPEWEDRFYHPCYTFSTNILLNHDLAGK